MLALIAAHIALDPHHVLGRDAVGDCYAVLNPGVGGLHDRIGGERRRHKNNAGLGVGLAHRVFNRIKYRPTKMGFAPLARRYTAN